VIKRVLVPIIKMFAKKRLGKVPRPLENMSSNPTILIAWARFGMALEKSKTIDPKLKSLAQTRAASLVRCPF